MFLFLDLFTYFLWIKLLWKLSLGFKLTHKANLCLLLHLCTNLLLFPLRKSVNVNVDLLVNVNILALVVKDYPEKDKINVTKSALVFLSRFPTHHSFTCNLQFLFEPKHKIHLCKAVCDIFHFWFPLVFIKAVFLFSKNHGLFDFKTSYFLSQWK